MKSLVGLLESLLTDVSRKCGADLRRDVQTLHRRVEHEGDGFLTIALPTYAKDFERSLADGRLSPGAFSSFRKTKHGGPAFLQGLLSQVFDTQGMLLQRPSVDCIRAIRQICLMCKKVERPCSKERVVHATEAFLQCDRELVVDRGIQLFQWFSYVADIICSSLHLDDGITAGIQPKHGPRATQERISGNQKWRFRTWTRRLEEVGFTHRRFGRASQSEPTPEEEFLEPRVLEPVDEPPVRVVFVPKTLKAPRVIAVEPVVMQYAQQGLKRLLVDELENSSFTAGHVNFRDQSVNQAMALTGSASEDFATLDMSEASDRVHLAHFETCFKESPLFLQWALAARSSRAKLPDGTICTLQKFASMGSALCFPVESLVFFVSIIATRLWWAGKFPTARNVHEYGRSVYVYGDDLIVPADEASAICSGLEALSFKVNRNKSFWTGKFRESCGEDCYAGQRVTPVYLRRDFPSDRSDASALVSCLATANQLLTDYPAAATYLRGVVEAHLGHLPHVPHDSAAIGWEGPSQVQPLRRWNKALQRAEKLLWVCVSPSDDDPLDGDAALAKCFRLIGNCDLPWLRTSSSRTWEFNANDEEHLLKSPRSYALALKRRWVAVE